MTTLTITIGLPGSGKSTWARGQQAADPNLWRINRDDLRAMVLPSWAFGNQTDEDMLTAIQLAAVGVLLDDNFDVIVDDTNLRPETVKLLRDIAALSEAEVHVEDFTHIPLEECITRDASRTNPVGEFVIRGMHKRYLAPPEAEAKP